MYKYEVTLMTGNILALPDAVTDFDIDSGTYMFSDAGGIVLASVPVQNVFTVVAMPFAAEEDK